MSKITFEVPFSHCVPPLEPFFNSSAENGLAKDWEREMPPKKSHSTSLQVTNLGPGVDKFYTKELQKQFDDPYIIKALSRYQQQAQYVMSANAIWSGGALNTSLHIDNSALHRTNYQDFISLKGGGVRLKEQSYYQVNRGWALDECALDGKAWYDVDATLYEQRSVTVSWRKIDEVIKDIAQQRARIQDPTMLMNEDIKEKMEPRIQQRRDQFVDIKQYFEDVKQLECTNESLLKFIQQYISSTVTLYELTTQLDQANKEQKITAGNKHFIYSNETLYRFINHGLFHSYLKDDLKLALTKEVKANIQSESQVTIDGHTFDRTLDGWKKRVPIFPEIKGKDLLVFMQKQDKNFTQAELDRQLAVREIRVDNRKYPFSMQDNGMLLPQFWERDKSQQPLEIRLQGSDIEVICPHDYQSTLRCMLDTDIIAKFRIYNPELGIDSEKLPDGPKETTELPLLDIEYMMGVCDALVKHERISAADKCTFAEDLARYKLRPLRDKGLLLDASDASQITLLHDAFLAVGPEDRIYQAKINIIFNGVYCSMEQHTLEDEAPRIQRYSQYMGWGTSGMLILMGASLSISILMPTLLPAAVMLGLFKIALPIVFGLLACACVYKHTQAETKIENIKSVLSENFSSAPTALYFKPEGGVENVAAITPRKE